MTVRRLLPALAAATLALAAPATAAAPPNWAAPEIRAVTAAGVLGTSPAAFDPQGTLTEGALASAVAAADRVLHPPQPAAPVTVYSTVASGATLAGAVTWQVAATGPAVDRVVFLVDGAALDQQWRAPYTFRGALGALATQSLKDGSHTFGVQLVLSDGTTVTSSWPVTVANAPGSVVAPPSAVGVPVPVTSPAVPPAPARVLYRAATPARAVTLKELDAALVAYLGLGDAARSIQRVLAAAGLRPRPGTGTEAVARMLGLRTNHPASQDALELLPNDPVTRAEAAYSFAQVLKPGAWSADSVASAAEAFSLPDLTTWQRTILGTAISYVGYPYIWGGTSPARETLFGVTSRGGFDCSGFVWRVFKLTPYAGSGGLASVLRGRTTYQMSGEVTGVKRIAAAKLQPGDVMFFGRGPRSKPAEVDHAGIYLGNGWFVHSSGQGVTLLPFAGWYERSFAWGRRPLAEAGLI